MVFIVYGMAIEARCNGDQIKGSVTGSQRETHAPLDGIF